MSLSGVAARLTAEERVREPRSLALVAYYDGYLFGAYGAPSRHRYPRRLDRSEEREWRAGFAEGRTERVCHSHHGFNPCPGDHPPIVNPEPWWKETP